MLYQGNHYQALDNNGKPLSGGKLKFFEPSTSTPKNVYSDAELTTWAGSEVTLDSAGRATVFLDGEYQVREEDFNGVEIQTTDGVNRQEVETSEGINNPSFETEGTSSTDIPGWTLSAPSGVTIERVTTSSYHGDACLEITTDGSNGGYGESEDFIPVSPGREYEVSFALESSSATVTNVVQVRWYNDSLSLVSTDLVYSNNTGNPTSWETKVLTATPPATARYAKVRVQLSEFDAGTTRYDDIGLDFLQSGGDFISNEGTTLPSILSDTLANRPPAGKEGRWYYATDAEAWYRDTGSAWEAENEHTSVSLGGAFSTFEEVVCVRRGYLVTITSDGSLEHSDVTSPSSATGAIPSGFRPSNTVFNAIISDAIGHSHVIVDSDGTLSMSYRDYGGNSVNRSGTPGFSITYAITGEVT